jgi:hypothetical protein
MAVMGLLAPLAGLIKVRYGEKADIDSPFFKVFKTIFSCFKDKLIHNFIKKVLILKQFYFFADALQNNIYGTLSLMYPRNSQ